MGYAQFVIEERYDCENGRWVSCRYLLNEKDQRTDVTEGELTYLNNLRRSRWEVVAVTVEGSRAATWAYGRGHHETPLKKVYLLWGTPQEDVSPSDQ